MSVHVSVALEEGQGVTGSKPMQDGGEGQVQAEELQILMQV